jgi:hypothetical protein
VYEAARFSGRGLFFFSRNPWAAVIVLAVIVLLVLYLQRRK